jgi:hypothetical protein
MGMGLELYILHCSYSSYPFGSRGLRECYLIPSHWLYTCLLCLTSAMDLCDATTIVRCDPKSCDAPHCSNTPPVHYFPHLSTQTS